jgi:predicted transcriptional regulator of viral defense system
MSYREVLRELSYDTHGVVTLKDAADAGVPAVELRKLASRGALVRLGKGVYRMTEAPHGPLDEFAEAVALVGDDAVLADEAVLAALDLAQVNLRRIKVATGKRVRHELPGTVEVVRRRVPDDERDDIDGIPAMSLAAALLAAKETILPERLADAVRKATARELLSPREGERVLEALKA